MFIWIGAAVLAIVLVGVLHRVVAMRLLGVYYEAEVLEHNGRECYRRSWLGGGGHEYQTYPSNWWKTLASEEEKERRIHRCARERAIYQSKHWIRTELSDWIDRARTKATERKEARINGVLEPLRGQVQEKLDDKRRVEAIVQELRNEPQLTEQEKFDRVYAHFVDSAEKKA